MGIKPLSMVAAALLIPTLLVRADANDSTAEIAAGGLVLTKSDDIEMRSEYLFVSPSEIRVDYVFYNKASQDKTITVAFPIPDITYKQDGTIAVPTEDPENIFGFSTTVDGKPVVTRTEQKVFARGVEETDLLRKLGVPLQPTLAATGKALDALPKAQWDDLIKRGFAEVDEYDAGKGMEKHLEARWTLKTTYFFEQSFPAGQELAISHRYKPSVGLSPTSIGTRGFSKSKAYRDYARKYCLNKPFLTAVQRATESAKQDYPPFEERRMSYILTTGANWAGPIRSFHLVVDKDQSENLVSFCGEHVTQVPPTRFEIKRTDFTPKTDLHILVLTKRSIP